LIRARAVAEADLTADLERQGARVTIAVLDACRDNPFRKPGTRSLGLTRGLELREPAQGVFAIYSAGFNQRALDRLSDPTDRDPNPVFTRVFLNQLRRPGQHLLDLGENVREEVAALAARDGHVQVPAILNQIRGARSVFLAGLVKEESKPLVPLPLAAGPQADEIAWSQMEGTSDPKQLSAFLDRFPRSALRPKAQARLDELGGRKTAALVPTPTPTFPSASEAIRTCDRLASAPADPDRPSDVSGVEVASIDGSAAVRACQEAVKADPTNRRLAFQLGRAFAASQQYGGAKVWFERAVSLGHPGAMNSLGYMHHNGHGVAHDYVEARRWFEKAAALGQRDAMANLGRLYSSGSSVSQDHVEAKRWFEKAANLGHSSAMNELGRLYHDGRGVAQNYAEARNWFDRAAALGLAEAMHNFAYLYANGRGVRQSYIEAKRWFEKAAALGNSDSMYNLGLFHYQGWGVRQDYAEARRWFEKAAALGNSNAMVDLGVLYANGHGVSRNYVEARRWYEKAAALGQARAMFNLANLHANGQGVPQDYAEARRWYGKAAALGLPDATAELSKLPKP
jgi:uncharacterized protein